MEQTQEMITPYLAAYFDRQDRARRFTTPGFMTRELSSYYHTRQKEQIARYTQASILEKQIEATRGRVVKTLVKAQTSENQAGLLAEAERLNSAIEQMAQKVTDLLDGR